uniref:Uncharacterized protein MANES_16G007000 n=1 Tax=Rhizophora mucronata TaxID=61149 RepID=A0A2P2K7A9_RHIMU
MTGTRSGYFSLIREASACLLSKGCSSLKELLAMAIVELGLRPPANGKETELGILLGRGKRYLKFSKLKALAPATISSISPVIFAWRFLL